MSGIWKRVSVANPCPICGRPDYCQFGDRAMKCARVESAHPVSGANDVGWYHFYGDAKPTFLPAKQPEHKSPTINAAAVMREIHNYTTVPMLFRCAHSLGVRYEALTQLGARWYDKHGAWAFPMFDACGETVGIRLRNEQGFKWAVRGSRQGIFIPKSEPMDRTCFLAEGPTTTAALLSMGFYAVGRPTCLTGNDIIKAHLRRIGIYRAVIVADNDDMKKLGPREGRPGIEGAQKLKRELGISSVIWIPPTPCKDARDFLKAGGSSELIMSEVNQKVWSRK